jgi:NAD(P)-dependent dehydrogenase (short-subunit alcohol dehydrogenase family)
LMGSVPDGRRVVLVTGASSGIGYAIAERLLADGFAVTCAVRHRSWEQEDACERLVALGPVRVVAGDLANADTPARLVDEALSTAGRLDAIVSNAGVTLAGPVLDHTNEDFDSLFAIDVRAAFLLARSAAAELKRTQGSIVFVTSVHEHEPRSGLVLYAAAKAALGMLSRGLALELAPRGIRVNAVAPGVIATARNTEAEALADRIPVGAPGKPGDVAAAVSFLLGDDARYVTGASLIVDGGLLQASIPVPAG